MIPVARPGVLAALLAALAAVALGAEPFRGEADIVLGETIRAEFPAGPSAPHRYAFFAPEGTRVAATVRAAPGASLRPSLRLTFPGGERLAAARPVADGERLASLRVPYAGSFVLEVDAAAGSGAYALSTSARFERRVRGLFPGAPQGAESFAFEAPAGARLSARVAPRKRGPRLSIVGVETPTGATLPVLASRRGPAAEVRGVLLPEDGRYRLLWDNRGAAGDLEVTFRFRPPRGGGTERNFGVSEGTGVTTIERGRPALAPRAGYVGSAACGRCHGDLVREWSRTAHNSAVRSWDRAGLSGLALTNDLDGNGQDDFRDGLDLATLPAFAAYGANAPKLLYDADETEPYRVRIGGATYPVLRTMGGNGLWAQRYLARTGTAMGTPVEHPLPFEWVETTRTYEPFHPEDWYDAQGGLRALSPQKTFAAQCSGCHETGATLARDDATGHVVTGFVETNIGCEQCHGPGGEHARTGDRRDILNPRGLLDGTAAGVAAANDLCARCHTHGASVGALPVGGNAYFGYANGRVAEAGDRVADFLRASTDPAELWGAKTNPLPTVPGDTFLAARVNNPHGADIASGSHAAISGNSATCFECHDPHRRASEHQVAGSVDRGRRLATRADDNSLCLACHAGTSPFGGVTTDDVAALATLPPPASIVRAVVDHMKDAAMPVPDAKYDPLGTGVGRCTSCHMPLTGTNGGTRADKGGFAEGDLHSHRFEVIWPNASVNHGVTNSCSSCHPTSGADGVGAILAQWASPAPGSTSYHGAVPPASQDGLALDEAVVTATGAAACVSCHTAEGFVRAQVEAEALDAGERAAIAKEAIARERGVTCDACHGRRSDGNFYGDSPNPLRVPKEELCDACHNGRGVTFADFRDAGAILRHPQREMLGGTAGDPAPGIPAASTTAHSRLPDGCVTCHYDTEHATGRHDFVPDVTGCASCHAGLATFDRPARADYDGDGVVSGIQTEVASLLDILRTALLTDARMSFANGRFAYDGSTALGAASVAQKRAVFNWYAVEDDGSLGVHNTAQAVRLLQASYRELTGTDVPGAILR